MPTLLNPSPVPACVETNLRMSCVRAFTELKLTSLYVTAVTQQGRCIAPARSSSAPPRSGGYKEEAPGHGGVGFGVSHPVAKSLKDFGCNIR